MFVSCWSLVHDRKLSTRYLSPECEVMFYHRVTTTSTSSPDSGELGRVQEVINVFHELSLFRETCLFAALSKLAKEVSHECK